MTRRTRRLLFITAVVLFVVIIPIILGYSLGYRYDFDRNEITQVGALSLKTTPEDARVLLNNEPTQKETPTILRGLLPNRPYTVHVEKESFYPWEKSLFVEPERITSADAIVLFPQNITSTTTLSLNEPITSFSVSPNSQRLFVVTQKQRLLGIDLKNNSQQAFTFSDRLSTQGIGGIAWSPQNTAVSFMRRTRAQELWYVADIEEHTMVNLSALYQNSLAASSPSSLPLPTRFLPQHLSFAGDNGAVTAVSEDTVLRINPFTQNLETLATTTSPAVLQKNNTLFFVQENSLIQKTLPGDTHTVIADLPFVPEQLLLSPDEKRLAFWHDFALGVVWLEDTNQQPLYKAGRAALLHQPLSAIQKVRWHTSGRYLLAHTNNSALTAVELDGRGGSHNTWQWQDVVDFDYLPGKEELWVLTPAGDIHVYPDKF